MFFVLEKLVLLRHCHTDECHVHAAAAPLIIFGDAFHNFLDGAIICTAVLTSVPLGINTAIAVAAHEIPQEVGDTAILLAAGYSRRRALVLNIVSGLSGLAGALIAYLTVGFVPELRPYVLALSSASLMYIAMSDLIPDLHRGQLDSNSTRQVALIVAGVGTVFVLEHGRELIVVGGQERRPIDRNDPGTRGGIRCPRRSRSRARASVRLRAGRGEAGLGRGRPAPE